MAKSLQGLGVWALAMNEHARKAPVLALAPVPDRFLHYHDLWCAPWCVHRAVAPCRWKSGFFYCGESDNITQRLQNHRRPLKKNPHAGG